MHTNTTTDFLIVSPMEVERDAALACLPNMRQEPPRADDVHIYYHATVPVPHSRLSAEYSVALVTLSEMGRVSAATVTAQAIKTCRPRYVLLVGIAGGVPNSGPSLGDVIVSNQVVDFEEQKIFDEARQFRFRVFLSDARLVQAALSMPQVRRRETDTEKRRFIGTIATGDKVMASTRHTAELLRHWPKLLGIEMEAGGVAFACDHADSRPGFLVIRGISDFADAAKNDNWRTFASEAAASYAVALIGSGLIPVCNNTHLRSLLDDLGTNTDPAQRYWAYIKLAKSDIPFAEALIRQALEKETDPYARMGGSEALALLS